ncbi:RnfABCDGE type electron transport complex subunit D [Alkaliphilus serpentinus]|uniref:RnfABCDGE type electron transport complex subunit D n=2 Tax=Alkaliphilus serpentinus TaxID=1482731 RepID=A0A833HNT7_9FIRM|nr:RnfABCDGE type electron transport complex subunit D [Alkaliphilus serpentinus]
MKQLMMRKVLLSLIPIIVGAVFFFGWRTLLLMLVVTVAGILTEAIFKRRQNKKISEAVIVTSVLFSLTLPVATPFWVAIIGIIFGVAFAKEVFGGFGHNIFNPALAARTFIYVCFPEYLTVRWNIAASSFPGGFTRYITPAVDAVSGSTPLLSLRQSGIITSLQQLLFGNASGSMGETSGALILLGAIILILTKTIDWKLMLSPTVGFVATSSILTLIGVNNAPSPVFGLLSGGFLFASVYFITEPITAPKNSSAKILYGLLIGMITILIRVFGIFVEGVMFSVLIMNSFAPIIDVAFKELKKRRQVKTA